jgi:hypothetical protein
MVTLNTMLLIGLIVALVTVVVTLGVLLLLGSYLGVKDLRKLAKERADEDEGVYTLPLSALQGMGGGGRMPTQAEVDQVKAAIAQARGGAPGAPEDKKEAYTPGGYC